MVKAITTKKRSNDIMTYDKAIKLLNEVSFKHPELDYSIVLMKDEDIKNCYKVVFH